MFDFFRRPARPARVPAGFSPRVESLDERVVPTVIANPDPYNVAIASVLTVPINTGVLVNDFDDQDSGAVLSATLIQGAKYSVATAPPVPQGALTFNPNGSFTFVAPSNYQAAYGAVTFIYRAVNRDTTSSPPGQATVTINITGAVGRQKVFAVASGPGAASQVRVFEAQTGNEKFNFFPYETSFTGGVRVATGDLNGDGVDDIVTVPASGGSARVKVFDGKFGTQIEDFFVFEPTFRGGADVAVGQIDGLGGNDLIIGAGDGGGPRVLVYDGSATGNLVTPTPSTLSTSVLLDFFAYEPSFRNGVRVAAGHTSATVADPDFIVTGSGVGGGPAVKVFDGRTAKNSITIGVATPPAVGSFFGFDSAGRGGISVAVGEFRGDGMADIVVGSGTGGSTVRVFDGRSFAQLRELTLPTSETPFSGGTGSTGSTSTFGTPSAGGAPTSLLTTSGSVSNQGGVRVGVTDRNDDGLSDIIAGPGAGLASRVRIYDGNSLAEINNFLAFPTTFLGGVYIGGNSL